MLRFRQGAAAEGFWGFDGAELSHGAEGGAGRGWEGGVGRGPTAKFDPWTPPNRLKDLYVSFLLRSKQPRQHLFASQSCESFIDFSREQHQC